MSERLTTETAQSCGHPNHGNADHDCKPFLPCADPACPCGPKPENDYTPEQIKAGATALYASGVTVPEGVSYADVVRGVGAALAASTVQGLTIGSDR